jgi:hypothetical protein
MEFKDEGKLIKVRLQKCVLHLRIFIEILVERMESDIHYMKVLEKEIHQ